MNYLVNLYGITRYDELLCELFSKIKVIRGIPWVIRKISVKFYGRSDNLNRYYMHRYFGIAVGKYTYGFESFYKLASTIESIGAFCSIADGVKITTKSHPLSCVTTSPIVYQKGFGMIDNDLSVCSDKKTTIGNDVWIGANAVILPGITIGNGAVIGAGAIVNRDIPDYAVAVGVPAKVIKYRFDSDKIDLLNKIQWWQWDDDKIRNTITTFANPQDFFESLGSS